MTVVEKIKQAYPNLKKVFFFHSHTLWPSHIETELELIELLQREEIKIYSFICNGLLLGCDANPINDSNICKSCISKRNNAYKLINKVEAHLEVNNFIKPILQEVHLLQNIEDLKKMYYKNFDIGYGALSSLVSRVRNPYITFDEYKEEFIQLLNNAASIYEYFLSQLVQNKPDIVIIFNGRFIYTRALIRACEALGFNYFTHERGANIGKFMLFENALPHDLIYFNKLLYESWHKKDTDLKNKIQIANKFYFDRANGKEQGWFSFTDKQNKNLLPDYWDEKLYNVVFFLSSEDEFIAIGDQWGDFLFNNQIDGLDFIFSSNIYKENFRFYIRIHPNSKPLKGFIEKLYTFESEFVKVIPPDSPISSYKLLLSANKIVTFGSTMGIEATFWGKPSICLGNCFYKNLDVTYNPSQKEHILTLINDKKLIPKEKQNTLIYGYHLATFGYNYKAYRPDGIMSGFYKGVKLSSNTNISYKLFSNIINRPYRLRKFLQKVEIRIRFYFIAK